MKEETLAEIHKALGAKPQHRIIDQTPTSLAIPSSSKPPSQHLCHLLFIVDNYHAQKKFYYSCLLHSFTGALLRPRRRIPPSSKETTFLSLIEQLQGALLAQENTLNAPALANNKCVDSSKVSYSRCGILFIWNFEIAIKFSIIFYFFLKT